MPIRKPTDSAQLKLRLREELRKRLEREAKKADHSLNTEMVRRLEQSFEHADLKSLQQALDGLLARQARQGRVFAGWIENELRAKGLSEADIKELVDVIRAYSFGGDSEP
jgi:hypothetical protein